MRTLRGMRARIRAAKSIQQITRAMKLVSAARLRRAQDRVLAARPYAQRMHEVLQELGRAGDLPDHPLLQNASRAPSDSCWRPPTVGCAARTT
jgi:F-type H+-transporting ATPase subunit gamma